MPPIGFEPILPEYKTGVLAINTKGAGDGGLCSFMPTAKLVSIVLYNQFNPGVIDLDK